MSDPDRRGGLFINDIHGSIGCDNCHGGINEVLSKADAHAGLVRDPSIMAEETCGRCHAGIASTFESSLHRNFTGYETLFEARAGIQFEDHPEIQEEFEAECGTCHTTCGQCHVSRPNSVKGGLVQGHRFMPTPNQSEQCTACHGSRVGEEYTGSRDGYNADVHYIQAIMNCMDCHTGQEMHGNGTEYETRYHSDDMPRCEDCHAGQGTSNNYHSQHWGELSCQVCHSQDYKSCNKCHVGGTGIREPSYISFKIGKNPIPEQRDYEYVALRHIPIATDTYAPWGIENLENYEALPSWKYASPHNIQRWTARTDTTGGQGCATACHTTPNTVDGFFLREVDMNEFDTLEEKEANRPYIVPDGPPPW
ncbi:hypothetical protein K8I28_00165 [bacterium]|nr:hypothetical protein [bacterium]